MVLHSLYMHHKTKRITRIYTMFTCTLVIVFIVLIAVANSIDDKLARQQIQSYARCRTDRDCKEHAFCFGNDDTKEGRCKCEDEFELIRNSTFYECLPGAKLGEACKRDEQCQVTAGPSAICNQYQICDCPAGERSSPNGACRIVIKLGEICMDDYNCYLSNGQYGFCSVGRCTCPPFQTPSENRTSCINARQLGEECASDEECGTVPNSRCSQVCRCRTDHTLDRTETACVKAATAFGENCTFDGQCSKFLGESICSGEKCSCLNGFHEYGSRCARTRRAGQTCEDLANCVYESKLKENVNCENGVCSCIFGVGSDGSCNIEKFESSSSWKLGVSTNIFLLLSLKFLY